MLGILRRSLLATLAYLAGCSLSGQGGISFQVGPELTTNARTLDMRHDPYGRRTAAKGNGYHAGVFYHTGPRDRVSGCVGVQVDRWVIRETYQREFHLNVYAAPAPSEDHYHSRNGVLETTRIGLQVPLSIQFTSNNGLFARAGVVMDIMLSQDRNDSGDGMVLREYREYVTDVGWVAMQQFYDYTYDETLITPALRDVLAGFEVTAGWQSELGLSFGVLARIATTPLLTEKLEFGGTPRTYGAWIGWMFRFADP